MIIDAKAGTINAILVGKDAKEGGVSFSFPYPERADMIDKSKDEIFDAICKDHPAISEIKHMIHDIELTFTADPVPINFDEKEMSVEELHKSFKQALEEIALQNAVIDVAVEEKYGFIGHKKSKEEIKAEFINRGSHRTTRRERMR